MNLGTNILLRSNVYEYIFHLLPRSLVKERVPKEYFSYFSTETYVVGTQKNCLNETVLLSTQNIC